MQAVQAAMEERRLKNILSHLSLCSNSPLKNSAVLSAFNQSEVTERMEKSSGAIPENTQWNPQHLFEERKALQSISKSRSSSNIFESRQPGFVEETFTRGARSHPTTPSYQGLKAASQCKYTNFLSKQITRKPSPEEQPSLSFTPHHELTTGKCECLEGDSTCLQMNDQGLDLRTKAQGYSLDTTGLTGSHSSQVQSNTATQFEHVCFSFDAKVHESEAQCKLLYSRKVVVDGFQAGESSHSLCLADDREAFRSDTDLRAECNFDKDVDAEQQTSTEAPYALQSSSEQNLLTCRDTCALDSQPVNVGTDTSGSMTLSRNNVMTGQRRHIVEDCIFCLIIQGQSPAFKLYEDEMCVCILDVHPLTHGHALLIPKAHFPSLELTPPEVAAGMCATVPFISMAIMKATDSDSFNLLVNSGKAAGQVVFHTHFHIIPRRSGDNLWRSEDDSRRALPLGHETALLVQQIRHNLSNKCL